MDGQVTAEQLLAKIGQLVIQLELAQGQITALQNELAELKAATPAKSK
jgi:hypothetical protein